ncbi:1-deoxy-D-xylulose-5-phosphate synthase [Verrucomicrobiota bacterium]|nr:1-deoxy-D-xylulose-5-phosphate synthase [Verrucomicrobiota bacterium]
MRTAFISELIEQARRHPDILLVVGDLGYSVVEPFAAEFPDRYLNAGVAEQNMTGVAAGLAAEGFHVFTYSIANFPTLRCLEQIRNDICYHHLPVTVVSVGAGVAYGNLGYSHHAVQDIAIMRTLHPITVLSPADPGEARGCVRWLAENPRPSYLRIGKAGEAELHGTSALTPHPLKVRDGSGPLAIVATGSVLKVALDVAAKACERGMPDIPVYSCPWLHPITQADFSALHGYRRIIAIEEHLPHGGLASILRENLPGTVSIEARGLNGEMSSCVGSQQHVWKMAGLETEAILKTIMQ